MSGPCLTLHPRSYRPEQERAPPEGQVAVQAGGRSTTSLLLGLRQVPRRGLLKKSQLRPDSFPSYQRLSGCSSSHGVV